MEKKKLLIIFSIILLSISLIGAVSAANDTTSTKKPSTIIVWDYYPVTNKYANVEYVVIYDHDNDGKIDDITYKDTIIQNIKSKSFKINGKGTYKVNLTYGGNNNYLPTSKIETIKFTGNEVIKSWTGTDGSKGKKYKRFGHTYEKIKLYDFEQTLSGKVTKTFSNYENILVSGNKYRLFKTANEKIKLRGIPSIFFKNKLKIEAYYDGTDDIKLNYKFYYKNGKTSKVAGTIKIHKYSTYYSWKNKWKIVSFTSSLTRSLAVKYARIVRW